MKNTNMKGLFGLIAIFLLSLTSCNNERFNLDNNDAQNVENEATTDGYFEDTDDMATLAVAVDVAAAGGRVANSSRVNEAKPVDIRFGDCVTVTFETAGDHTQQNPHGYITIDFGSGCTDPKGNVRSGIINVEFIGKRFLPGAKIITTLENYFINGVKLEGTRTVTNITGSTELSPKFSIVLVGGKATWPDGSTATRIVNRTREWIRGTNPLNDEWIVDGTASGTNRNEVAYTMEITTPLVYKRECAISKKVFLPVEGVKVLTTVNNIITIDYGNGDCDKTVTVTINGKSKTIEVRGDI
jgi:hypothetical protein